VFGFQELCIYDYSVFVLLVFCETHGLKVRVHMWFETHGSISNCTSSNEQDALDKSQQILPPQLFSTIRSEAC
jgi:hypothetical protein